MIPAITHTSPVQALYLTFLDALKASGFTGDLCPDYANRTVLATDNSIYQILPQGVIYPKDVDDLRRIAELSNEAEFQSIVLSPRGGGTGTNGQSLTDGLVVDISKHMNQILEINVEERWARVQAGVVKDQLNEAAKAHGLFFAPELSTSNRATIGGMINTDASGQGSCEYGKTRDHVLELTTVLLDGSVLFSRALTEEELKAQQATQNRAGQIHRVVDAIEREFKDDIAAKFPKLNRCLTGYDLAHIRDEQGRFNLNNILCGAEGTLGFVTEAKINLLPIPKYTALVNLKYSNFDAALRHATELMRAGPTSIETLDSKVMALAKSDIVWHSVGQFFAEDDQHTLEAINLVEYCSDDQEALRQSVSVLTQQLEDAGDAAPSFGYSVAWGEDVAKVWGMRKKSVGLLGKSQGEARPIPFVEDTAVPPENLADYILEFRALLDNAGLKYGMFGHVDAGVLHVRPAIDMKDPEQEKLVRYISDEVVKLTDKYHGLIWGEHGKGVRSEYATTFFGDLYPQLQRIKAEFDPRNQLNPGKIATPSQDHALLKIDQVATRGQSDRKIPVQTWEAYSEAVYCNGNGACYNYNPKDAMCPSWKATRERVNSPKGRSSLIREWLKQLSERGISPVEASNDAQQQSFSKTLKTRWQNSRSKKRGDYDFNHEVHESLMACLACKSCVGQCPINVDVPEFRAKFLELYYARYLRPLKDYFIGSLEHSIPYFAKAPWLYNGLMALPPVTWALKKFAGMVDSPKLSGINLERAIKNKGIKLADSQTLATLTAEEKEQCVIVVQDAFTSFFETQLVLDAFALLQKLGFTPLLAPFKANGKPLHVHGFLKQFKHTATDTAQFLNELAGSGIAMIGLEPSMTLAYRAEYQKYVGSQAPPVLLIQEWLVNQTDALAAAHTEAGDYKLLAHCTEKTNAAAATKAWHSVFGQLGMGCQELAVGCCGMSGTFGHERDNLETSKTIYQLSWQEVVENSEQQSQLMATGYSCRSQAKRESNVQLPHPVQVILSHLR